MCWCHIFLFFFFKQKTAYEMRISDWSSDVCSSDLLVVEAATTEGGEGALAPLCPVVGAALQSKRPEPAAPRIAQGGAQLHVAAVLKLLGQRRLDEPAIGRASCLERVCQYV